MRAIQFVRDRSSVRGFFEEPALEQEGYIAGVDVWGVVAFVKLIGPSGDWASDNNRSALYESEAGFCAGLKVEGSL